MSEIKKVPAHIAKLIAADTKAGSVSTIAEAILSASMPPRISTRASRFRLVENNVEKVLKSTELDVVIVGMNPHVSKAYYPGAYDPNQENQRPDCSSANGITPDANVTDPVCSSCAKCEYNILGSKTNENTGNATKACSDTRYMAVVSSADFSKPYSLGVSVTAMKPLREYFQELANYNIKPEYVVTRLGFDEDASYPKLTFELAGYLPAKAIGAVAKLMDAPEVLAATRVDVDATPLLTDESEPAKSNVAQFPAKGETEEEEDEAPAKPAATKKKRTTKKATAKKPAPKKEPEIEEIEETEEVDEIEDDDMADLEKELAGVFE